MFEVIVILNLNMSVAFQENHMFRPLPQKYL